MAKATHHIHRLSLGIALASVLTTGCERGGTNPPTDQTGPPTTEAKSDSVEATVRIATIQLDSSLVGNYEELTALAVQAKEQGAELVIFPEASAFGWLNPAVFTESEPIPGSVAANFQTLAQNAGVWVATGLAEESPEQSTQPDAHGAYDSGLLINPTGEIVIHHRKYAVLQNAFDEATCQEYFGTPGCSYTQGSLDDITVVDTPFGPTALIVCADAYTYDPTVLNRLKELKPTFVIVPWGVAASAQAECGTSGFNATEFAAQAAAVIETAYVVGANAIGDRPYGRYLPSVYCGNSGYANPDGTIGGVADTTQPIAFFDVPIQ